MRRLALAATACLLLGALATPAAADPTRVADDAARWRGRYCPPTGCGPGPGASWAGVVGFGLAAAAAVRLGGRGR